MAKLYHDQVGRQFSNAILGMKIAAALPASTLMSMLQSLLTPPTFEDETKTHQAFILHYILLVLILVPVAYAAFIYYANREQFGTALTQAIPSELINIFLYIGNRRGHTRLASMFQVGLFWLFFTWVAFTRLGVQGTAYILGSGTVIVIAGLLLGGRISLVVTFLSVVAGGWMVYLNVTGSRYSGIQPDSSLQVWVICTMLFLVIHVVQYLSSKTIRQALDRAQSSENRYRSLLENIPAITYIN
jgi:PAS domain-containing protein